MDENKKLLLKNYLANMQVNINVADYTKCTESWRELNYTPAYNKFYFICEGEGWLKIGDKEFYPMPGQLFLMPAGINQSYSAINSNGFKKYWCHFTATIGDINLFEVIQLPYYINVEDNEKLRTLFMELISNYKSQEIVASLKLKSLLLEIIAFFIENTVVEKICLSNSSASEKISSIIKYIEDNLGEDITIEELARMVHFHPNYFIKFFRRHLGVSPMQYINKVRMDRAKNLVKTTDTPIKEIAVKVGYRDLFYFSKAFKGYTGFSPSEFRNN
jgi:AraC family transcriptional regulator, arabinose operon regulatory protein